MAISEADTCRRYITPALKGAGWDIHEQIAQERSFTDGRVVVVGSKTRRKKGKRADYVLRYTRDLPLAVVEAKAYDVPAANGLQQAIDYARILRLPFAYAANGREIIEHDLLTGKESRPEFFPGPNELWERWQTAEPTPPKGKDGQEGWTPVEPLSDVAAKTLLTPGFQDPKRQLRYYQTAAINRAVQALARGKEKVLLTLATGTGKSFVAFQICYRMWQARWNRKGTPHRPKILYLADRTVLIDQPKNSVFAPFGDALHIIKGKAVKSREMYFATYQQIAPDESRPGLYREYAPDFFDLVVVDECHRGSARDESNWREILDYYTGAAKLGMTATPLREDNRDTYQYFGNPVIQYSLADGIEDGFLAPYKVRRVLTDVDAAGWRPTKGQKDRYGQDIPDQQYGTADFAKKIVLPKRTEAIAQYIVKYLESTDPYSKTLVFCVDQEHASNMREAIARLMPLHVKKHPDFVCRVTADEGDIGRGHLDRFQDIDRDTPVILTTSEMLTTGVDAPTVKNVVLCRVINSMTTFKQVIGRGTRLRTDYDKWYFTILDFTGTATRNFADPDFDGYPAAIVEQPIDEDPSAADEQPGESGDAVDHVAEEQAEYDPQGAVIDGPGPDWEPRKFYVDDVQVEVTTDLVYELDADGRKLRTVKYTEYAKEKVRTLYRSATELRVKWTDPKYRREVLEELEERGIDVGELARRSKHPEADAFDLLCHVAFNAPIRTRSQRAAALRKSEDFWNDYTPQAREILSAILDKYTVHGAKELRFPQVLEVPPISTMGNVVELSQRFGGAAAMRTAFERMQQLLYAE